MLKKALLVLALTLAGCNTRPGPEVLAPDASGDLFAKPLEHQGDGPAPRIHNRVTGRLVRSRDFH